MKKWKVFISKPQIKIQFITIWKWIWLWTFFCDSIFYENFDFIEFPVSCLRTTFQLFYIFFQKNFGRIFCNVSKNITRTYTECSGNELVILQFWFKTFENTRYSVNVSHRFTLHWSIWCIERQQNGCVFTRRLLESSQWFWTKSC